MSYEVDKFYLRVVGSMKGAFGMFNKRQKDCLWKQRTHYRLKNGSLGFTKTLHKQ